MIQMLNDVNKCSYIAYPASHVDKLGSEISAIFCRCKAQIEVSITDVSRKSPGTENVQKLADGGVSFNNQMLRTEEEIESFLRDRQLSDLRLMFVQCQCDVFLPHK